MRKTKINKEKNEIKERAYAEFSRGGSTQRDLAVKYDICETELSRFFSSKYKSSGYPKMSSYQNK